MAARIREFTSSQVADWHGPNRNLPIPSRPTPSPPEWVRPADWAALPAIGAQEFQGVMSVTNDASNYRALLATT